MTLTKRQGEVLEFIKQFMRENSYAPTFREIGEFFGFTPNGVMCHLQALQRKGAIVRDANRARGIRLTEGCPTCGR